MGIASSDKNTIRKMSEIEAVIYDRFLQKSPPTRRLPCNPPGFASGKKDALL